MSSHGGLLSRAMDAGTVGMIAPNAVQAATYGISDPVPIHSVGLRELGRCIVVIVASKRGAVVGYFAADIPGNEDPSAYLLFAEKMMDGVQELFNQTRENFEMHDTRAYVVYGTSPIGNIYLRGPLDVVIKRFNSYGWLAPLFTKYKVRYPEEITERGPLGTIWISEGDAHGPKIYLEDEEISQWLDTSRLTESPQSMAGPSMPTLSPAQTRFAPVLQPSAPPPRLHGSPSLLITDYARNEGAWIGTTTVAHPVPTTRSNP